MSAFLKQLKWQLLILHRNNIITISIAVTFIYGMVLYALRGIENLDIALVTIVMNDPAVIGYFFIALAIYLEIKHQILPAIFVSPINLHVFLLSKAVAISIIGTVCSLGLAFSVSGFEFDFISFTFGAFGICMISAILALFMVTFASEFLQFALISIPIFIIVFILPMIQYLGIVDFKMVKYLFPIQGSLNLIDAAVSKTEINYWYAYGSTCFVILMLYWLASNQFEKKIVNS